MHLCCVRVACVISLFFLCFVCSSEEETPPVSITCDNAELVVVEVDTCGQDSCPAQTCSCLSILGVTDASKGACLDETRCLTSVNCEIACQLDIVELANCSNNSGDNATGESCESLTCDSNQACLPNGEGPGEPACQDLTPCEENSDCTTDMCREGFCQLKSNGSACRHPPECLSGFCAGESFQDRRCQEGALGDPCDSNSDCLLSCVREYDSARNTFYEICTDGAIGNPCNDDEDCELSTCVSSVEDEGIIRMCSDRQEGSLCDDNEDCDEGACVGQRLDDGREIIRSCSAGRPGDPCNHLSHCEEGLACRFYDTSEGICGIGNSDEGESCIDGEECTSGICVNQRCNNGEDNDRCEDNQDCLSGICLASALRCSEGIAGDDCDDDEDCQEGVSCVAHGGRSNVCSTGSVGEGCETVADCKEGTFCVYTNNRHLCLAGIAGDACNNSNDCQGELTCARNSRTSRNECSPGMAGDICNDDEGCQGELACIRNSLTNQRQCSAGTLGEICDDANGCQDDLFCVRGDDGFRCLAGAVGDNCNDDQECQDSLSCVFTNGERTCSAGMAGDICNNDEDCQGELTCEVNTDTQTCSE